MIRSLSEEKASVNSRPSYIPANKFSTVLLNIIQNAETEGSLVLHGLYTLFPKLKDIKASDRRSQARADLERLIDLARLSITAEGGQAMGNLMLTALQKEVTELAAHYPELKGSPHLLLEKAAIHKAQIDELIGGPVNAQGQTDDFSKVLRGTIALRVTNPGLRLTLSSLFIGVEEASAAGGDCLQVLRSNLESWFNDLMDRLSGRYKRKAQLTAFIVGLVIATLLNVDTINISNQLWREPIVRQAINANAAQIIQNSGETNPPAITDLILNLQDQFAGVSLPVGWVFSSKDTLAGVSCSLRAWPQCWLWPIVGRRLPETCRYTSFYERMGLVHDQAHWIAHDRLGKHAGFIVLV